MKDAGAEIMTLYRTKYNAMGVIGKEKLAPKFKSTEAALLL
jgi:hypothetical protein